MVTRLSVSECEVWIAASTFGQCSQALSPGTHCLPDTRRPLNRSLAGYLAAECALEASRASRDTLKACLRPPAPAMAAQTGADLSSSEVSRPSAGVAQATRPKRFFNPSRREFAHERESAMQRRDIPLRSSWVLGNGGFPAVRSRQNGGRAIRQRGGSFTQPDHGSSSAIATWSRPKLLRRRLPAVELGDQLCCGAQQLREAGAWRRTIFWR
ncbi:unnamed protein product [Lampetra fluviatilis]